MMALETLTPNLERFVLILAGTAVVLCTTDASAQRNAAVHDVAGAAVVLDGDTMRIGADKVRLHGVDAFEAEQTCVDGRGETYGCGGRATRYLSGLIGGGHVACSGRDVDRYGRLVAVCRVGSVDLGKALVRAGHALAYRRYSSDYVAIEDAARAARAGAWTGRFMVPAEYRSATTGGSVAVAQRHPAAPSGSCAIKGNINRKGQRIYHLPVDPYYAPTRAEAMFCSESEAAAAGFRRAGRPRD